MKTNSRYLKRKRRKSEKCDLLKGLNKRTLFLYTLEGAKMGEDNREGQRDGGVAASLQYFICQQVSEHHRTAESALPNSFTVYE